MGFWGFGVYLNYFWIMDALFDGDWAYGEYTVKFVRESSRTGPN